MNQANQLWGESHHYKLYRSKKERKTPHSSHCIMPDWGTMSASTKCRHTHSLNPISEPLPLLLDLVCFLLIHFLSGDQRVLLLYWIFGALSSPFSIGFSSFWTEWVTRLDFDGVSCGILDFLPRKLHFVIVQKYNKTWSTLDFVWVCYLRASNSW